MDDFHPQQLSTYALTLFQHEAVLSDGTKVPLSRREERRMGIVLEGIHFIINMEFDPLDIWDTAGQEVFSNMHPAYYDKAHVCILVGKLLWKP
mgnify:CR=1 FL=1